MRKFPLLLISVSFICFTLTTAEQDKSSTQTESLDQTPIPESAKAHIALLNDPDAKIRKQAILSLRNLATRISRNGVVHVPKGPDFPPKVKGLVPWLIKAADDEDTNNRIHALFALADTRDSMAVKELKNRLNDPDEQVRFKAACLLTEFDISSGLPELMKKLIQLMNTSPEKEIRYYSDAQHLIVSFQRITGESFGKIPLLPHLHSSFDGIDASKRDYDKLLKAWNDWWEEKRRK